MGVKPIKDKYVTSVIYYRDIGGEMLCGIEYNLYIEISPNNNINKLGCYGVQLG